MRPSPNHPGASAIEMRNVTVGAMRDESTVVVEEVEWTVAVGDYWAVAGLQGSGKSDFLMMTGGLIAPLGGSYRFFGQEMPIFDEARLHDRLRLGMVFETGQLFNQLSVAENIALPLRYHRNLSQAEAEPEVQRFLESMELGPWADSTPGAIGRNWQKRVGLARALILQPEVLLVDSPLTGLDLRHINWWLGFLDQLSKGHALLQGRAMTMVVTAGDLRPWKGHARQFAILKDKRLSVLGAWEQLESAEDELIQELLATGQPSA